MSDWNWSGEDEKESLVVPRVDALAVYTNVNGHIVIRQQHTMGEDDSIIVFPSSHAAAVIAAIQEAAAEE